METLLDIKEGGETLLDIKEGGECRGGTFFKLKINLTFYFLALRLNIFQLFKAILAL